MPVLKLRGSVYSINVTAVPRLQDESETRSSGSSYADTSRANQQRSSVVTKRVLLILALTLLLVAAGAARHLHSWDDDRDRHQINCLDDFDIEMDGDVVILTSQDRHRDVIEITEDLHLSINGDQIEIDRDQTRLVGRFYDDVMELEEYAEEIGAEGERIGRAGAALGQLATAKALRALSALSIPHTEGSMNFSWYDWEELEDELEELEDQLEDLEDEMEDAYDEDFEIASDELEQWADGISDLAEEIEDIADDVQDSFDDMVDEIPELEAVVR